AADGEYEGMGLGLFIARTLLERTGAKLSFANGSDKRGKPPGQADLAHRHPPGAIIEIRWPPGAVIAPQAEARGALGPNRRFDE
ncbi:MAG TPA: hypothetical protein VK090_02425, partial [Paracoccaceae bacterium]|nr:hypothetical protein [Paracoccaceae bacterium]